MNHERINILRVVEYEGPRKETERQVAHSLHGEKTLVRTGVTIRCASLPEKEADYFRVSMGHVLHNLQVLEDDWSRPPRCEDPIVLGDGFATSIKHVQPKQLTQKLVFSCGHVFHTNGTESTSPVPCPTCLREIEKAPDWKAIAMQLVNMREASGPEEAAEVIQNLLEKQRAARLEAIK